MVPPWFLGAGGGEQIHALSRELKRHFERHYGRMQHMCTMAAITPQVRTVCTLENPIPENQPGRLSYGQSLVSCSDCMQTWQMSVECDHAQKRYLQTCTTSNFHCLIASLDARSTTSSLYERINKEAITLLPKGKVTTGDTCKCHPEKQDTFYMIGWGKFP